MILFVISWIILALTGIKYCNFVSDTAFNKENSIALRGICSIEIMLGHLGIETGSLELYPNRKAGILFVGVFFALSGYGLMYSITHKDNYLDNFLKKRLPRILAPAYVVFLINIIIHSMMDGNFSNLKNVVNLNKFIFGTNWYVWELLAMYVVFYLCARLDKSLKRSHLILLGFSLIFICAAFGFKWSNPWYGSTMCFWFGIYYYLKKDVFISFFVLKHAFLKFAICGIFLAISIALFFCYGGIVGNVIARNTASLLFVVMILIFLHKFSIGNSVSAWLGQYSYEIYLFHPVMIKILRPWIKNNIAYTASVIGMTILASFIYRKCTNILNHFVRTGINKRVFK